MRQSLKRLAVCAVTSACIFIPAANRGAVPFAGTACLFVRMSSDPLKPDESELSNRSQTITNHLQAEAQPIQGEMQTRRLPAPVRFREVNGRGLLVRVWVNDAGPYTFALDTGAGATILSRRVADEARVSINDRRALTIGGLSGAGTVTGQEVVVHSLAAGDQDNFLPAKGMVIVTERLAPDVDGVLDPTESYWPLGFEIDMPHSELTAFDPRVTPLRRNQNLPDGTVVPWLLDGQSRRPYVMLEGGSRALIDTGSGFGLAVTPGAAASLGIMPGSGAQTGNGRRNDNARRAADVRDLAGNQITARRIAPATVQVGALVLRSIPTDLLPFAEAGAPVLLGRDALRPFRLTFDPLNRLIRIVPG